MTQSLKNRFSLALRVTLAALIMGLLFRIAGWDALRVAFMETRWSWMIAVYLVAIASILVNAALLRFLMKSTGLEVGFGRVLLAKAQATFVSLILPGDMFAGAAKWANLSAATGDRAGVLSAMVFSKVALAVPPLVIGSIALTRNNPFPETGISGVAAAVAVVVLVVTVLMLHRTSGRFVDELMLAASRKMPLPLRSGAQGLVTAVRELRTMRLSGYLVTAALSLIVFGLAILGIFFAAKAVDITVPVTAFFWVIMFLFISRLLPLTVGNIGVREGILVLSFGLYGIEPATAILVGLLMFSSLIIVGVIGAAYQVAVAMGWLEWTRDHHKRNRAEVTPP